MAKDFQKIFDDFQVKHEKKLDSMNSRVMMLWLDIAQEIEDLGLDTDNAVQLTEGMFDDPLA